MFVWSESSAAQRSMPERDPAVGRRAVVERLEHRPEHVLHPLPGVALQREALREQVRPPDPDRAAAELPAVQRDVVLERPGPPGRVVGRRVERVARRGHEERLVVGQHAAERVVGRVPAAVLRVPLVHREAVDPAVREDRRVGQAEPPAELDPEAAQHVGGRVGRVGDDQDRSPASAPVASTSRCWTSVAEELRDGPVELAVRLDREVDEALRPEPLRELRQVVDLAARGAGHPRARRSP